VVAGLKAERARKAVAEVGRARARAVMVRGADIVAAVDQEWRGGKETERRLHGGGGGGGDLRLRCGAVGVALLSSPGPASQSQPLISRIGGPSRRTLQCYYFR
jgi:hypothetical protein